MLRAIRALLHRRKAERELEREIAFHIENETAKNIAAGMHPDEAARRARVAFGSVESMKETHRDGRGARWIEDLVADLRYAFRQIRHAPVFTAIAVFVLAVGIGVNSALVAFVESLVRPRIEGVANPHELIVTDRLAITTRDEPPSTGFRHFLDFAARQQVFVSVGGLTMRTVIAGIDANRDVQAAAFFSGDYLRTVRPQLALGTIIPAEDDRAPVTSAVALVSHTYWRVALGADSSVVGRTLVVNGVPTTIAGVFAQGFRPGGAQSGDNAYAIWIPYGSRSLYFATDSAFYMTQSPFTVIGRLKPGLTVIDATAELSRLADICRTRNAHEFCRPDRLARVFDEMSVDEVKTVRLVGLVLSILTILILAVSCANVSILLLGRAVARRREIAVRLSLGAARARIVRQLLTESIVLSVAGGAGGLALLLAFRPVSRALLTEFHTDLTPTATTIAISFGIAMLTGIAFGLVPALHATNASVATALKEAVAGFDRRRARLQRGFVIAEVTISIALVSIMALFVQAARQLASSNPGFDLSESVLIAEVPVRMTPYARQNIDFLLTQLRERLTLVAGVAGVSIANGTPQNFYLGGHALIRGDRKADDDVVTRIALIDADYFRVTGVRIRDGRPIETGDERGAPLAAVVASNLAARLWPGKPAVGQFITFAPARSGRVTVADGRVEGGYARLQAATDPTVAGLTVRVVGVADSVRNRADDPYLLYISRRQVSELRSVFIMLRTNQPAPIVVTRAIDAIHSVDRDLPVSTFRSTAAIARASTSEAMQVASGALIIGAFTLALACIGLFAVVAFAVAHRAREIGIRIALGATRTQVVGRFFREGMRLAAIGLVIGVAIAIAFMRITQSQVNGIPTLAPAPIAIVVGALLTVTALASWIPARRATRVDPIETLRTE